MEGNPQREIVKIQLVPPEPSVPPSAKFCERGEIIGSSEALRYFVAGTAFDCLAMIRSLILS